MRQIAGFRADAKSGNEAGWRACRRCSSGGGPGGGALPDRFMTSTITEPSRVLESEYCHHDVAAGLFTRREVKGTTDGGGPVGQNVPVASPGGLPPLQTPATGASGASGLTGGATAPPGHPQKVPPAHRRRFQRAGG
eukprot:9860233-Alexandrium_andersonii.AAC.1